jgi:hypothetical protein
VSREDGCEPIVATGWAEDGYGGRMDERTPVRLERLVVRRFRHVARPVALDLGDGAVLVIGRNGTGKTNLLKLIDAVTRLDFRAFEEDPQGLDIGFRLRWPELTLEMELDWDPPTALANGRARRRYRFRGTAGLGAPEAEVRFEVGPDHVRAGHDLAEDEEVPSPFEPGFRNHLAWFVNPEPVSDGPRSLRAWLVALYDLFAGPPSRFDEALCTFEQITEATRGSFIKIVDDPMGTGSSWESVPRELVTIYRRRAPDARGGPVSGEIDWMHPTAAACGFDRLEVIAPPPREERSGPGQTQRTYAGFTWYAERGTSRFPHHDFSFGQKRIVAAFWYLACVRDCGGAVVADELVNGMHHQALALILEQAEGLQAFLASQNPLLFDFMEYGSAEDFRTRIVRCDPEPDGWSWRNPTTGEAERFLASYEVGIQHVSEILRTDGLW